MTLHARNFIHVAVKMIKTIIGMKKTLSGVTNPSSAPALIVVNIFYAVKLEKWIACFNTLIMYNSHV